MKNISEQPQASLKVFVYGTLKPGESNYTRYCHGYVKSQIPAYVRGIIYHLPVGYPAMTEGNNLVQGVLLTFNDVQVLASLDRLEGYNSQRELNLNEYYRCFVPVYNSESEMITQAWTYFMTLAKVKRYQGQLIPSNVWTGR